MKKVLLLMVFCLSLYEAKAVMYLWKSNLDNFRYELFNKDTHFEIYRFDKSTGEVYNVMSRRVQIDPVSEQEENLLDGVVKYCLYYDEHNIYYLLNLKTGKTYKCRLGTNPEKEWQVYVE